MMTTMFCDDNFFRAEIKYDDKHDFTCLNISVSGDRGWNDLTLHSISDEQLAKIRDVIDKYLAQKETKIA